MTLTGDLDEVISLCKQTVDLVTSCVLTQTGAMAQIKVWRAFLERIEPHNKIVWDLIPRTYKSLQKLADSASGNDFFNVNRLFNHFDMTCVFAVVSCRYVEGCRPYHLLI